MDFGGGWESNAREGERPEFVLPEDLGLPGGFTDKQVISMGLAKCVRGLMCKFNEKRPYFVSIKNHKTQPKFDETVLCPGVEGGSFIESTLGS